MALRTSIQQQLKTSNDLQNTAMLAIFDLCFLSPPRQEQAAVAGIVPKLINLLDTNIKNLSLKVFCDLAHAKSNICREQLGLHQGVAIYLKYMADRNRENRIKCFTSLSTWLMKDIDLNGNSIVEIELLKPNAAPVATLLEAEVLLKFATVIGGNYVEQGHDGLLGKYFYSSSLFQTCFIDFVTFSSI